MIGLLLSVFVFNLAAFNYHKNLTKNQMIHIWVFTVALQTLFDVIIDFKYHGYWYFSKAIDWKGLPATTMLVPPVNIVFLNGYPFKKDRAKKIWYIAAWLIFMLGYETLALMPEPWGYFQYGWWNLWISAVVDIVLLYILLVYFKWIRKIEKDAH